MADGESIPCSRAPNSSPGENPLKGLAVSARRPALGPLLLERLSGLAVLDLWLALLEGPAA
jgi:hypothetical protein